MSKIKNRVRLAHIEASGVVKFRLVDSLLDKEANGKYDTFHGTEEICRVVGNGEYVWDKKRQICIRKDKTTNTFSVNRNKSVGRGNKISKKADNSFVVGQDNVIRDNADTNFVSGYYNKIDEGLNYTTTLGSYAHTKNKGEIVFGAGVLQETDVRDTEVGQVQSHHIQLIGQTTNAEPLRLKLCNEAEKFINLQKNTVAYIEAEVIGLRISGQGGELPSIGQVTTKIQGHIRINNNSVITLNQIHSYAPEIKPVAAGRVTLTDGSLANTNMHNLVASRTSTGIYNLAFATARPNANYVITAQVIEPDANRDDIKIHVKDESQTTSGFTLQIYEGDNGGSPDTRRDRSFYVMVHDFVNVSNTVTAMPTFFAEGNTLTVKVTGFADQTYNWLCNIKMYTNRTINNID